MDENENVSTRFYDVEITAQDAAGNVGKAVCSVIVVPPNHYGLLENDEGGKGGKKANKARQLRELKGGKGKGGKKGGDGGTGNPGTIHDPNDLRKEYPLSTQRYLVSAKRLLWNRDLDTKLIVPPRPPLADLFSITSNVGAGKGGKKSKSSSTEEGDGGTGKGTGDADKGTGVVGKKGAGKKGTSDATEYLLCNQPVVCPANTFPIKKSTKKSKKSSKKSKN